MTWNARNLLSYSKNNATISYSYNADGIRRSKQSANEEIIYDYAGSTLVHEYHETSGIDIFYSYDSKGHLMMIETLQNQVLNKYYVAVNSRGDVERIYNSSKALVAQYSYDSWGKVISVLDGNGNTPTSSTHIANLNPIRYRGYYYDSESGFYYLQSRYYDPNVQRFINSDEISVVTSTLDQITDKNLYTYCDNNPIMRYDDEGEFWNTLVNTVAGAISGGLTAALSGENIWDGALSGAATGFMEGLVTDIVIVCCTNPVTAFATLVVSSSVINGFFNYAGQIHDGVALDDINWLSVAGDAALGSISTAASYFKISNAFDDLKKFDLKKIDNYVDIPDKSSVTDFALYTNSRFFDDTCISTVTNLANSNTNSTIQILHYSFNVPY